jgi:low temperature requirement protein LtrA
VGGVIVASVADELVLAHPAGRTEVTTAAAVLGGPALFLLGNLLFKRAIAGRVPLSHLAGLGLLAGLVPAAAVASPLLLGAAVAAALAMVALWETVSLRSRRPAILEP